MIFFKKKNIGVFLKQNSKFSEDFEKFKAAVKKESGYLLKVMRSDRGGKITSKEFVEFCEANRIRHLLIFPRSPQLLHLSHQ